MREPPFRREWTQDERADEISVLNLILSFLTPNEDLGRKKGHQQRRKKGKANATVPTADKPSTSGAAKTCFGFGLAAGISRSANGDMASLQPLGNREHHRHWLG